MRVTQFLAAVLLVLCACKAKPPEVPQGLKASIDSARQALSVGNPDQVREQCEQLTVRLMDFSKAHPRGEELKGMAAELNELAHAGLPAIAARDAFTALEARIGKTLAGDKPGPGPRLRLDAPVSVRDAVTEVDDAFHRWALPEACDAVDQTTMRLSQWRWEDPAPARVEKLQAALDVLDPMPLTCRADGVQVAQQKWDRAISMLAPGVE